MDADLFGDRLYLIRKPACPAGGNYSLGNVGTFPTCTLAAEGHLLLDGDGLNAAQPTGLSATPVSSGAAPAHGHGHGHGNQ